MTLIDQLDTVLKYMAEHSDNIPLWPDVIAENAGLKIDKSSAYLLCDYLYGQGLVERTNDMAYSIKGEGVIFWQEGGFRDEVKFKWTTSDVIDLIAATATIGLLVVEIIRCIR